MISNKTCAMLQALKKAEAEAEAEIAAKNAPKRKNTWSDEESDMMREMLHDGCDVADFEYVAETLNRTLRGVVSQFTRLRHREEIDVKPAHGFWYRYNKLITQGGV